jgi:hypothetical protein
LHWYSKSYKSQQRPTRLNETVGWKDDEEEVTSYWMTLKKQEDAGN